MYSLFRTTYCRSNYMLFYFQVYIKTISWGPLEQFSNLYKFKNVFSTIILLQRPSFDYFMHGFCVRDWEVCFPYLIESILASDSETLPVPSAAPLAQSTINTRAHPCLTDGEVGIFYKILNSLFPPCISLLIACKSSILTGLVHWNWFQNASSLPDGPSLYF